MRILLGVTGCIGAYKAAEILRGLQREGADVQVVMTLHATEFVRPLTFEALSGRPVITGMFDRPDYSRIEHISVARDSDLLLVAPATANIIAKFAHGIADDFLSTVYLSNTNPVLIAPAMNVEMWRHAATQENLAALRARGVEIVDPDEGYQACGEIGVGRLADIEEIVRRAMEILRARSQTATVVDNVTGVSRDMTSEHILLTAGPTVEDLDPVRFLTNRSSGKMGYALAEAAHRRGARVTLVSGPTQLDAPHGIEVFRVRSTAQMYEAVMNNLVDATVFIGCAAVSDFRPVNTSKQKIKKQGDKHVTIELEPTEDIIGAVSQEAKGNGLLVAGFAAESEKLLANAESKLRARGLDLIVANDVTRPDTGFDVETNAVTIIKRDGSRIDVPLASKCDVANRILDEIVALRNAQKSEMLRK
jgi:phosphopantothenoylcysteine decarboxylase / phosphopantothenate---cysteine ligase